MCRASSWKELTSSCGSDVQANAEKLRLETKQRAARKAAEQGEPIKPHWFTPVPGTESAAVTNKPAALHAAEHAWLLATGRQEHRYTQMFVAAVSGFDLCPSISYASSLTGMSS